MDRQHEYFLQNLHRQRDPRTPSTIATSDAISIAMKVAFLKKAIEGVYSPRSVVTSEPFFSKTIDSIKSTTPPRAMMIDMLSLIHI